MAASQNVKKYNLLIGIGDEGARARLAELFRVYADEWATVLGVAGTGAQCQSLARRDKPYPDVLLVGEDVADNVHWLTYGLRKELPWLSVVLLTNGPTRYDQRAIEDALLAGFAGRTPLPTTPDEVTALRRLIENVGRAASERRKIWETHERLAAADTDAHVIAIYGPKGGVGRTVIAAKLAALLAESAATSARSKVALCELSATAGDLSALLGVKPPTQEKEPIRIAAELGRGLTEDYADRLMPACLGRQNLRALFAPQPGEQELTPNDATGIIFGLSPFFGYLVIDTSAGFSKVTSEALALATHHILVTTPDYLSIESARRGFERVQAAQAQASSEIPVDLIINRYPTSSAMPFYKQSEIREHIGLKDAPIYTIDDQPDSMRYALDTKSLLVGDDTETLSFTKTLKKVSERIVERAKSGKPQSSVSR